MTEVKWRLNWRAARTHEVYIVVCWKCPKNVLRHALSSRFQEKMVGLDVEVLLQPKQFYDLKVFKALNVVWALDAPSTPCQFDSLDKTHLCKWQGRRAPKIQLLPYALLSSMPVTTVDFLVLQNTENHDNEGILFLRLQNIFSFKIIYTWKWTTEQNNWLVLIKNHDTRTSAWSRAV